MSPTFALYLLATSRVPSEAPRSVGQYGTRTAALEARERDILEQLRVAGGRRLELTYAIVTWTTPARSTTQLLACSVGQPMGWPVDLPSELAETARWLRRVRAHRR